MRFNISITSETKKKEAVRKSQIRPVCSSEAHVNVIETSRDGQF